MGSDAGDMWREHKKDAQDKRASNRERSAEALREAGFEFESKNGGAHLIVTLGLTVADFWPGTGKYQVRGGRGGRGVYNLMPDMRGLEASRG